MISIPSSVKQLLQSSSVKKNLRISFPNGEMDDITNSNIISESLSFDESICSQSEFKFGLCEASGLNFETVGVDNIKGKTIDADLEVYVEKEDKSTTWTNNFYGTSSSAYSTVNINFAFTRNFPTGASVNDLIYMRIGQREVNVQKYSLTFTLIYLDAQGEEKTSEATLTGSSDTFYTNYIKSMFSSDVLDDIAQITKFNVSGTVTGKAYVSGVCLISIETQYYYQWYPTGSTYKDDLGAYIYSIPLGRFIVDSCKREASDLNKRKIVAYSSDAYSNWDLSLLEPLKNIRGLDENGDIPKYIYYDALKAIAFPDSVELSKTADSNEEFYDFFTMNSNVSTQPNCSVKVYFNPCGAFTSQSDILNNGASSSGKLYVAQNVYSDDFLAVVEQIKALLNGTSYQYTTMHTSVSATEDLVRNSPNVRYYISTESDVETYNYYYYDFLQGDCDSKTIYTETFKRYVNSCKNNNPFCFFSWLNATTLSSSSYAKCLVANFYNMCPSRIVVKAKDSSFEYDTGYCTTKYTYMDMLTTKYVNTFPSTIMLPYTGIKTIKSTLYNNHEEKTKSYTLNAFEDFLLDNIDIREMTRGYAELNAKYGVMDRTTHLYKFNDINTTAKLSIGKSYYSSLWYADDVSLPYSAVTCTHKTTDDDGYEVDETLTYTIVEDTSSGEYQTYDISDNWIIENSSLSDDDINAHLETIGTALKDFSYYPVDLDCIGYPQLEVGDKITINTPEGSISTYVLERTLSGIQALSDSIISEG